jgi:hypothetical protein
MCFCALCDMLGAGVPMLLMCACSLLWLSCCWSCVAASASSGVALQYLPVLVCSVCS